MKLAKNLTAALILAAVVAGPLLSMAQDPAPAKVKPYSLKTCLVTGEKLGSGGMSAVTLTNNNQEIKLCCKGCLKDFKKNPEKYMKKLEAAEKDAKK